MESCRTTREFSTFAIDVTKAGYDTSWLRGQHSSSYLTVPAAPTLTEATRYSFRLCGVWVPRGAALVGVRQAVQLVTATDVTIVSPPDQYTNFNYRQVYNRDFCFPNGSGNIAWGITSVAGHVVNSANESPEATAGRSQSLYRTDSALLFVAGQGDTPPAGGAFVGDDVGGYGLFYDMRFGSHESIRPMRIYFKERSLILFWASVKQPPAAALQPTPPVGFSTEGLMEEDRYLIGHPTARYGSVSGSLIIDYEQCCDTCCPTCGEAQCVGCERQWGHAPSKILSAPEKP